MWLRSPHREALIQDGPPRLAARRPGAGDNPPIPAQPERTGLQFSTATRVESMINGSPLDELLSGQGRPQSRRHDS
ncbi:MAG: hypothetical protein GYA17_21505 [Chloroflexi bacterium]|nr:hypothetical protein [Chloroflexota bacterium]